MPKTKVATKNEIDLNRWCIEMAMRWPVVSSGSYGGSTGSYMPAMTADADVIGRANKIMAWVKQPH